MKKDWEKKKDSFPIVDVRKLTRNFLPGFLNKARQVEKSSGICVVQSFEPVPLYSAMASLGFEHVADKVSDEEYRAYFYRKEIREAPFPDTGDAPLKPTALLNFKKIDNSLGEIAVNFWNLTWGKETPAIDLKTKLLLSLANGVGAGRLRQATRELIKAYSLGVTVAELDELFSLFVWNGGIGTFASEIGTSTLFEAYQTVKTLEDKGKTRKEVMSSLMEKFGDKNPEVNVLAT
jgi:alkylhydroperoxidase/carboxymuconolactone decarboxylase family protein YurZ